MNVSLRKISAYAIGISIASTIISCAGDQMQSGLDPFAPTIFKEGSTEMPLNPPNKTTLLPFYVSQTTIFKFAIDTSSILIGADGVTLATGALCDFNNQEKSMNSVLKSLNPNTFTGGTKPSNSMGVIIGY